jgi:hypothetical protein
MQRGDRCVLTEPTGERFDPCFVPDLTPSGSSRRVFGGKHLTDCRAEFRQRQGAPSTASARPRAAPPWGRRDRQPRRTRQHCDEGAHPNAARLFLDWYLSDLGQKAMSENLYLHSAKHGAAPPPGGEPPRIDQIPDA